MFAVASYYFTEAPIRLTFFSSPQLGNVALDVIDLVLACVCVLDTFLRLRVLKVPPGLWLLVDVISTAPVGALYRLSHSGNTEHENDLVC